MHEILEKVVIKAYIILLEQSHSPAVSAVLEKFKDIVDREALDAMYSELDFNITEDNVSSVLVKIRSAHSRYGEPMFDAQNTIFEGWLEHIKLLR
jgi:hypothetical protein